MDDQQREAIRALGHEIDGLVDEVETALEEHAPFSLMLSTRAKVEGVVRRYKEAVGALSENDRFQVERSVGRKLIDLQKVAAPLPAPPMGKPAEKRPQKEFFEARPISASSSRQPRVAGADGYRREGPSVGREVEAWCNRCEGIHTHTILAVSGSLPVQVTCHACKGTHKYREAPPPKREAPVARGGATYRPTAAEAELQQRAKEKRELLASLEAAQHVRTYDPKQRYKAGEVIEHPEYGRGKIENTLQRSMLVRFAAGLKTLRLG